MAREEPLSVEQSRLAMLVLEDGSRFVGRALGAATTKVGEVCFNTSMTGYQEIMTDPSYAGQIVVMTATEIGNCGINPQDMESIGPYIRGFVMRESSPIPSNWRSRESLDDFLSRHGIPAIEGIDTRRLVRILRQKGYQRGVITTLPESDAAEMRLQAQAWSGLEGLDLTREVACTAPHEWSQTTWKWAGNASGFGEQAPGEAKYRVAVLDFGIKHNILRSLAGVGCHLSVLPGPTALPEEVLATRPDGIFLSNGPGDPAAVTRGIATIRELTGKGIPVFGICLGHQMLSLALGGTTEKMKFGHRGGNHPVQNLATKQVEVTSQNHGFMVREESLPAEVEVTHRSLFDGTVEGMRHRNRPIFSVQYHPEASPGPHDAHYLFGQFVELMQG
ncbi:MAG: glutamine-hydrolyzing carbamoyl-phosphate synthase small subunit [Magnetococcales bacterium]|nr:glutamine-hydrolyzing carbamoyl-phosphate synthase small subunit [Magnetococcales bacterium]